MSEIAGIAGARAVVTGAASGIGRATALVLLKRANVVAVDRDEAGLPVAADAGAEPVVCDVTDVPNGALQTGDSLSGGLVRAAGKDVGSYAITKGSLTAGRLGRVPAADQRHGAPDGRAATKLSRGLSRGGSIPKEYLQSAVFCKSRSAS